jgi:hypothetical protein
MEGDAAFKMVPQVFPTLFLIATTALSILEWSAGLRYWRFVMGASGALVGMAFGLAVILGNVHTNAGPEADSTAGWVAIIVGGVMGAALFAGILGVGTFLFSWLTSVGFVLILFQERMLVAFQGHAFDQVRSLLCAAAFVGLIIAVTVMLTRPHSIIVMSSLSGAACVASVLVTVLYWPQVKLRGDLPNEATTLYWMLTAILTALGILLQYLVTARGLLCKRGDSVPSVVISDRKRYYLQQKMPTGLQRIGPFTDEVLESMYRKGGINGEDLCWPDLPLTLHWKPLRLFFPQFSLPRAENEDERTNQRQAGNEILRSTSAEKEQKGSEKERREDEPGAGQRRSSLAAPTIPAPVKDNMLFYYKVKDEEKGPYTFKQLTSMWDNGQITADALHRRSDSSEWLPLLQRFSEVKPLG